MKRFGTSRGTCCDDITRFERHVLGNVGQHHWNREDHVGACGALAFDTVHPSDERNGVKICRCGDGCSDGTERVVPLGPCPLTIALLPVTSRDIVQRDHVRDSSTRLRFRRLAKACAKDDGNLTFELDV